MNILSLFDGISCGRVALERANIQVDKYYSAEIDKYAIAVSKSNYPDIIRLGDICNWRDWNIDWSSIDLIIAGSPCQGFSSEGKKLNFNDPRSKLFTVFVDILKHTQEFNSDVKFLLENVVMKKEWSDLISDTLGISGIHINSSLVSAQNRRRLYWTNIPYYNNLFNVHVLIRPLVNKQIMLDSVLEKSVGAEYDFDESKFAKPIDMEFLPPYASGLTECLTEEGKCIRRESLFNTVPRNRDYKFYKVNTSQKANCLIAKKSHLSHVIWTGSKFRFLTPIECERLQTLPDNYTKIASNTQRYKMLGNCWTVDIIAYFLKGLNNDRTKKTI